MRKDIWSFFFFAVSIEVYRYAVKQWLGDTSPIEEVSSQDDAQSTSVLPEKLLVRKLGKEFLIRTRDIQWVESSGNYVNLHVGSGDYPMRTLRLSRRYKPAFTRVSQTLCKTTPTTNTNPHK